MIGYTVGGMLIPFAIRQSWSAFWRAAFLVPSPYLSPLRAYGLKLGRITLFLSLLPLSISYPATIAWGEKGWRNRLRVWRDREALCDRFGSGSCVPARRREALRGGF